jgi:hypothetical protein
VTTAEIPIPKLDVLLLFDVTGSMRDELEAARQSGFSIMDAVSKSFSVRRTRRMLQ